MKTLFLLPLALLLLETKAHAYETDEEPGYLDPSDPAGPGKKRRHHSEQAPPPGDRIRKLNLALDALKIPREGSPWIEPMGPVASFDDLQAHFPAMDPDGGLRRYLNFEPLQVSLFREFFSQILPSAFLEFSTPLHAGSGSFDSPMLVDRLHRIADQVRQPLYTAPLSGLTIVIDPGHMGTDVWDTATGKYVQIGPNKVSEGMLSLWTSYLLAQELENLGARVALTRERPGPVSGADPDTFDASPYRNQTFYNGIDSWMAPFTNQSDDAFISAVKSAPETAKAFSRDQIIQYFISGEDLEARSRIIDQVNPDLVLDIHFDANQANQLQNIDDSIEAFVPGGIRANETGSRILRGYHLKHLLDVRRWNESVELASSILQEMSGSLNLPLQNLPEFLTSIRVKDGVYARNLYINRRNLHALTVYLECLHYDHVSEFRGLTVNNRIGNFRGQPFRYPARLNAIVSGIRAGVLRYFRNLH